MFNPVSKENWVYKRWFKEGANYNKDNTVILHTTYKNNKFLPKEYIENLLDMDRSNPAYFRIYALGEFATLDKLIYTNWKEKIFDYREVLRNVKGSKAIFSLDFGFTNDPTAFVCSILDEINKKIWVFDGFEQKGLLNDEIAKKIIEMGILTQKSFDDCQHIGVAVLNECDCIISWNFKHIVNVKTIRGVRAITNLEGYKDVEIWNPSVLLESEG